ARPAADLAGRHARPDRRVGAGQDGRAGDKLSRSPARYFPAAPSIVADATLGGEQSLVRRGRASRAARRGSTGARVMPVEQPPVYTVGHSTRSIAKFVELLRQGQVDLV